MTDQPRPDLNGKHNCDDCGKPIFGEHYLRWTGVRFHPECCLRRVGRGGIPEYEWLYLIKETA